MLIEDFCKKHGACIEGREWAKKNCPTGTMAEAWAKAPHGYLIWIATRPDVLTNREFRLFACWCTRQVWHLLTDERSKRAVEVAEAFAEGNATKEELDAAADGAYAAAYAAYARAAAARAAADAAYAAARAAADAAASDARADARAAQDEYLREQYQPFGPFAA